MGHKLSKTVNINMPGSQFIDTLYVIDPQNRLDIMNELGKQFDPDGNSTGGFSSGLNAKGSDPTGPATACSTCVPVVFTVKKTIPELQAKFPGVLVGWKSQGYSFAEFVDGSGYQTKEYEVI